MQRAIAKSREAASKATVPVRMPHLLGAVRLEFEKLEKPLTEAELGSWR